MTHPDEAVEKMARAMFDFDAGSDLLRKCWLESASAGISAYLEAISETHAIVPRQATSGMFRALIASFGQNDKARLFAAQWGMGTFDDDYAAMLDAAPPAHKGEP